MEYKIVNYNIEYKEKLRDYLHLISPHFSDSYIEYIIDCAEAKEDEIKSMIVVDEGNNIAGCHLFYNTKVVIKGEVRNIAWGHDTFLNEKARRQIGLEFVLKINNTSQFGIGLSQINKEIHKKTKSTFFDNLYNYVYPIYTFPISLFRRKPIITGPQTIKVDNFNFTKVNSSDCLNIPNEGFWNLYNCDVDFIRDAFFMNKRFFHNKVHDYIVYQLDGESCYYVVRYILFRKIPTLYLVDFRYDLRKPQLFDAIIKASEKLAKKEKLGMILLMSNDSYAYNVLRKKYMLVRKTTDFISSRKLKIANSASSFITAADADVDFIKDR